MMKSSKAVFIVNLVNFENFVRTPILFKFFLPEREISHKVHGVRKVHGVAGDCAP
jgi:hypothetical protein